VEGVEQSALTQPAIQQPVVHVKFLAVARLFIALSSLFI
jgi:hypothetical protein